MRVGSFNCLKSNVMILFIDTSRYQLSHYQSIRIVLLLSPGQGYNVVLSIPQDSSSHDTNISVLFYRYPNVQSITQDSIRRRQPKHALKLLRDRPPYFSSLPSDIRVVSKSADSQYDNMNRSVGYNRPSILAITQAVVYSAQIKRYFNYGDSARQSLHF